MGAPRISEDQVRHVARLAALTLTEAEVEAMGEQLGAILGHMEELAAVDTRGVEPTFHAVPMDSTLREDRVVPSADRELYLGSAPRAEAGAFAVPRVLDGGG